MNSSHPQKNHSAYSLHKKNININKKKKEGEGGEAAEAAEAVAAGE